MGRGHRRVPVCRPVRHTEARAVVRAEQRDAWDVVVCWKLDRLATGSIYLNKVVAWCNDRGKSMVSVTENFNLSTWVGRLIANVIAGVAEVELEAVEERTKAAEDHQTELEAAVEAMDELTALLGTVGSRTAKERFTKQIAALDAQIQELEQLPMSEARTEYRPTGRSYADVWNGEDTTGRRDLLVRFGITAKFKVSGRGRAAGAGGSMWFELRIPEDIRERVKQGESATEPA
ncbi:recombinase family protein [Nocardia sp. NPDC052112]|uniref:recombinase family protein n=1 Tax=Nocardia sp. NPDC052112 TaxID=3155646 RepID=UPI0034441016